jgi:hypothetical protein
MPLIILTVVGRPPPWLGHLCRLSPIAAFALRNFTARCFGWILPRRCLCLLPRHGFRTAAAWVSRRFNPTLHTILHTSDTYDTIDTCIYTYDMIIETYNLYIYNVKPLSYPGFKS